MTATGVDTNVPATGATGASDDGIPGTRILQNLGAMVTEWPGQPPVNWMSPGAADPIRAAGADDRSLPNAKSVPPAARRDSPLPDRHRHLICRPEAPSELATRFGSPRARSVETSEPSIQLRLEPGTRNQCPVCGAGRSARWAWKPSLLGSTPARTLSLCNQKNRFLEFAVIRERDEALRSRSPRTILTSNESGRADTEGDRYTMSKQPEEGWYTDPYERHEARWLSEGEPSKLVRDGAI
jgi:hypothetical protein